MKQISPSWGVYQKFRLPNVYTIIHPSHKNKERFLKGKRKGKRFLFMTMLSLKQAESNNGNKEPCEQGCSWIIKLSCYLNFGCHKYGIIIFSI